MENRIRKFQDASQVIAGGPGSAGIWFDSVTGVAKVNPGPSDDPAVKQLVDTATAQTLTNKTLTSPILNTPVFGAGSFVLEGTTADAFETTVACEPTADRVITLPDATDTLVGKATTDTLTNKTLTSPVLTTPAIGVATGTSLAVTGALSSSGTAGVGYATGAGGTQTQATDKSTTVVLNKICGEITMNAAELAADAIVSFTLTNSTIAATDVLVLNHASGGTVGKYVFNAQCGAGSAVINVTNISAGALSEAVVIRFVVIKAVAA